MQKQNRMWQELIRQRMKSPQVIQRHLRDSSTIQVVVNNRNIH
jgi:hypothetical protein